MSDITKKLGDFRWTAIDGKWNENDGALTFEGGEYTPIKSASAPTDQSNMDSIEPPEKLVQGGTVLFSENFKEGRLKLKVEFEEADYRAQGGLIIQSRNKRSSNLCDNWWVTDLEARSIRISF
jgi:hypothetical protein